MKYTAEKIRALKAEKDAVILAHYYAPDEAQAVADYVGDSFYLAKAATETRSQTIVFCGVHFMGESAKILNPSRRVLMPDLTADCAMAHMATEEQIKKLRAEVRDLAVVCYINSTARLKSLSDVCVTSSNAVKIARALPEKIYCLYPTKTWVNMSPRRSLKRIFTFRAVTAPYTRTLPKKACSRQKRRIPQPRCSRTPNAPKKCAPRQTLSEALQRSLPAPKRAERRNLSSAPNRAYCLNSDAAVLAKSFTLPRPNAST